MSGGSLDYVYLRVQDAADSIRSQSSEPHLLAFARHLDLVAKALKDVEWVLSGDNSPGDERPAVMRVVDKQDILDVAEDQLRAAIATAEKVLGEIFRAEY